MMIDNDESGWLRSGSRDRCGDCGGEMVFCDGPKRISYWRHIGSNKYQCSSSGESLMHKQAKKLLVSFLRGRGKISFEHTCDSCGRIDKYSPPSATGFDEEIGHCSGGKTVTFDVAGLASCKVIFGIEVWYSHKTTSLLGRSTTPWFEVEAMDVIRVLNVEKTPSRITLKDHRGDIECKNPVCSMSMKDLACSLGYLHIEREIYACEARRIIDEAVKGKYIDYEYEWNTSEVQWDNKLWDAFLSRQKCMKCEKSHHTTYGRPFCLPCYKQISNGDGGGKVWISISDDRREMLRRSLDPWIQKIPGDACIKDPCHFCKRSYYTTPDDMSDLWKPGSNYMETIVWYMEKDKEDDECNRACCTACLQEQMRKRRIIA